MASSRAVTTRSGRWASTTCRAAFYAIADYDAAILNKPDFPEAYHNRGFAFDAKGERERAVEDFKQARDLGLQRLGDRSPDILPPLP